MAGVAIVTGASRGIGAAVAKLLGANEYRVCVNYRAGRDAAEGVAADIVSAGGEALAIQADVADPDAVRRLFENVDERLGPVREQLAFFSNTALGFAHRGKILAGDNHGERERHGEDRIEVERYRAGERTKRVVDVLRLE